jgi:AmmeMemoRadiSam system protein B
MSDELIPIIRDDLQVYLFVENDEVYANLSDLFGIAKTTVSISKYLYDYLVEFPAGMTYKEFRNLLGDEHKLMAESIISNIIELDKLGFMQSNNFLTLQNEAKKEYEKLINRPYICADNSYPENPEELVKFLEDLFQHKPKSQNHKTKGIIVPHIDLRLKEEAHYVYSAAYNSLQNTDFDLLVILGTAHYKNSDIMMLTTKNYSTPLGYCETDKEFIELWQNECANSLTIDEFAHIPEHSIEYQILLSQYFFKGKKFKVLPILVGSFYDFIENKQDPEKSKRFNDLINSLKSAVDKSNKKVMYLSSVDFSHVGRKFGHDFNAEDYLSKINEKDSELIDSIVNINKIEFFDKISKDCDEFNVCGTAPIYTMLSLNDYNSGELLEYNIWNEVETKSAVSYASIALY